MPLWIPLGTITSLFKLVKLMLYRLSKNQNISSSFLVPPSPVLMLVAQSRQALSENGKSFIQFLQVGLLQVGQGFVSVFILHK